MDPPTYSPALINTCIRPSAVSKVNSKYMSTCCYLHNYFANISGKIWENRAIIFFISECQFEIRFLLMRELGFQNSNNNVNLHKIPYIIPCISNLGR